MASNESPDPTELIYVPGDSWAPILVAAAIALLLAGTFMGWFLYLVAAFILLLGVRSWWGLADDEVSRMRTEQRTDTAVIPAEPIRRTQRS